MTYRLLASHLQIHRLALLAVAGMLITLAAFSSARAQSDSTPPSSNDPQSIKQIPPPPATSEQPAPGQAGTLINLQEMLAIALKHNPDVRAAEASVRSAEVELDRTRLEVVQKVIAFRQRWQTQQSAVRQAEVEVAEYERMAQLAKRGVVSQLQLMAAARAPDRLSLQKTKLSEIEAELPFLLGQAPGQAATPNVSRGDQIIRDEALPKARKILDLAQRAHQQGEAGILAVAAANRDVLDWELQLAENKSKKVAILREHRKLLESMLSVAKVRHDAGQATAADVLRAELEIAKLDLRLLNLQAE